mmetsp:Transcript_13065/g.32034  ORF Transcript_13065/g.32034 Transcript_13065/m.32034 type:complete len:534 (-) Transcript_13065:743-2344(-)
MRPPRASKKADPVIVEASLAPAQAKAPGDKAAAATQQRSTMRAASRAGHTRLGSESPTYSPRMRSTGSQSLRRKRPAPVDAESDDDDGTAQDSPATCTSANHNKYCHFCQHVKVRASSMLACENQECCRRFCEHCLLTHLKEDVDPMSSDAWSLLDGKPVWHCPICRTKCCCSVTQCEENHRHCKAYRYRRRRAELATKRMTAAASHATGDKRGKKGGSKASTPKGSAHTTPTMVRPTLSLSGARGEVEASGIDSPPMQPSSSAETPLSVVSRPRREAALKRRYALHDDDDDDEAEQRGTEASSPASEEGHQPVAQQAEQGAAALPQQPECQDTLERDVWEGEHARHTSVMQTEMHYRSDADEEVEHLMLGGIYGHMSHMGAEVNGSMDAGDMCGDEMLLDDVQMGTAELDEARWLRRTYETVYNPSARQRALQALTGDAASKAKAATTLDIDVKPEAAPLDTPPAEPAKTSWGQAGVSASASSEAFVKEAQSATAASCESEISCYLNPVQPKTVWDSNPGGARKCTVMYDFV